MNTSGNTNWEVECATQFTGARFGVGTGRNLDLRDCMQYCQLENQQRPNIPPVCVGVTFELNTEDGEGNCVKYSTLTCATRGNSSFASARLLYAGYPAMTDYDPSFNC